MNDLPGGPGLPERWPGARPAGLSTNLPRGERCPAGPVGELPPADALRRALRYAVPSYGPGGRGMTVIGNVLTEAEHNPGLLELVRRHAISPRRQPLIDTLLRLREEGTLRPD